MSVQETLVKPNGANNMSNLTKLSATIAIVLGVPVASLAVTAAEVDANGDGMLTIDEVQAVFPDISMDTFNAMDINADGALDTEEVASAQEAGIMPLTDS